MLVGQRMTKEPITAEPNDLLSRAAHKMQAGGFHRLPIVEAGQLVGIVTDRDLRAHFGHLGEIRINGVMTEKPFTVTPPTMIEDVAQILLERQIGGLPVLADGQLVGIITTSDVMRAFLDVMGASQGGTTRIDFMLEGEERSLAEASRLVAREGGEILGVGTYRAKADENPVCYLRIRCPNANTIAKTLRAGGFNVLGVHEPTA